MQEIQEQVEIPKKTNAVWIIISLLTACLSCVIGCMLYIAYNLDTLEKLLEPAKYSVMRGSSIIAEFDEINDAINKAATITRSVVVDNETGVWIQSNFLPFMVFTNWGTYDFSTYAQAVSYATRYEITAVYFMGNQTIIWEKDYEFPEFQCVEMPLIRQMPELPRGCEVTSLAMLLNYYGVDVTKMQLAAEVAKDDTSYSTDAYGNIYYGNPYDGFVGDMYNFKNHGYGVYHGPIADLASTYLGEHVIDITGASFEEMLQFVARGYPVWVVTNTSYAYLPSSQFQTWYTPTGVIQITYKMHSVVITGLTEDLIFINDPLDYSTNKAVDLDNFRDAWNQMGQQAVVIVD
ncbi:MAG: hypothetical protein BEN18_05600 [Epulopiscium sp. Nuni2H_MBin001]|nr:MAG: hypothetical protein BEN18_05600 [Epulopiscium sp. Nuni2H_MBin001]